jgi:oligoribonuclease
MSDNLRLCWTDVEATGLRPEVDQVLEIGMIITEGDLTEVDRFHVVTNAARGFNFAAMDKNVQEMHEKSGLWYESLHHGLPLVDVDNRMLSFLNRHGMRGTMLAGSSVYWDRSILRTKHQWIDTFFHYRLLDVTTFHEASRRFWPGLYENRPPKREVHRVLEDLEDSMNFLRFYLQALS